MKVYLLRTPEGKPLFYSEVSEGDDHPVVHQGLRGRFERKARKIKTAWQSAEHGMAARVRRLWSWLQRRTPADETMHVRMRSVPAIEVAYPSSLSRQEAERSWQAYLDSRSRTHLSWFGVNALISPLTVLLAPLPGPNLIGYWFAYRAVRHLLALLGLRRVRSNHVALSFHPNVPLDRNLDEDSLSLHPDELGVDSKHFSDFVQRSGMMTPAASTLDRRATPSIHD